MDREDYWYNAGKYYLEIEKQGIDLFKKYLVNCEKLFQSEMFHHELAYVVIKQIGDRVNDISFMVFDEQKEELYIIVGEDQYKYSLQEDGLYLNDFMVDTRTLHIPEFGEAKTFIKK